MNRSLFRALLALPSLLLAGAGAPQIAWAACDDLLPVSDPAPSPTRDIELIDLARLRQVGPLEPIFNTPSAFAVSPDGKQAAFVITRADPARNSSCVGLALVDLTFTNPPRLLDHGGQLIRHVGSNRGRVWDLGWPALIIPSWSPDGRSIAYLRRDKDRTQLWLADVAAGTARPLTEAPVDVEKFAWNEAGDALVYGIREGLIADREALSKEALAGYHYDERMVPAMSNSPMLDGTIKLTGYLARIDGTPARRASPEELKILPHDDFADGAPAVAAVVGRDGRRAEVRPGAGAVPALPRIVVTTKTGRKAECQAATCHGGIVSMWWDRRSKDLLFLRREGWNNGERALYRWRPGAGDPRAIFRTEDLVSNCAPAGPDLLCLRESATRPARLVSLDPATGKFHDLLELNPEFRSIRLGSVERLHWRDDNGLEVRGDLVLPPGCKPGKPLPTIVTTYTSNGFLRAGFGDEYPIHPMAARGFAVLSYNRPKPIEGTGPDSIWADRFSKHSAIMNGIKILVDRGIADPAKIGLTGLSDGSTTTEFALVNSQAIAAASVSSCCMDDSTVNVLGGTEFAKVLRSFGYPAMTDPGNGAFWRTGSVVENASRINTPLLIQVSDHEYLLALHAYTALKEQRKAVDMFVFPDEFHGKWQPAHRMAVYRRNVQWFEFWLNGREEADPVDQNQYVRWRAMKDIRDRPGEGVP